MHHKPEACWAAAQGKHIDDAVRAAHQQERGSSGAGNVANSSFQISSSSSSSSSRRSATKSRPHSAGLLSAVLSLPATKQQDTGCTTAATTTAAPSAAPCDGSGAATAHAANRTAGWAAFSGAERGPATWAPVTQQQLFCQPQLDQTLMPLPATVIQGCSAPVPIPQDRSFDLAAVAAAANQMTKQMNVDNSFTMAAPGSYAPFLLIDDDDDDDDDLEGLRVDRAASSTMLGVAAQGWQSSLTMADVASAGGAPPAATTTSQAAGCNSTWMSSSSAAILRCLRQQHQHHSCQLTSQPPAPEPVTTEIQHEQIMQLIDDQLDHLVRLRQQLRARSAGSAAAAASSPPVLGGEVRAGVLQPLQVSPQVSPDLPAMQGSMMIDGTRNTNVAGLPRDLGQPNLAHVHMQQQGSLRAVGALRQGSHCSAQSTSQTSNGPGNKQLHPGALNAGVVGSNLTDFVMQQQEEVHRGAAWINVAQQKLQQLLAMRQMQVQLQAELLQLLPLGQD